MTDRDETTGIPMAELRDAGVEQHLRPLQDELDRIADGSPLMKLYTALEGVRMWLSRKL